MISLRTRLSTTSPSQVVQTLALKASALKSIRPWNLWLAQNDVRLTALLEKLSEKALLAAEALEQAVGSDDADEIERVAVRMATLQVDADTIIQDAFSLLNASRQTPLSREQTRALTRAIRGIFDAVALETDHHRISPGFVADPDSRALASTLSRAVEQLRLAVSGLQEPLDQIGVLRSCSHVRALQREGELLQNRLSQANGIGQAMMEGLERCGNAASVLENVFGPSKRVAHD